MKSAQTISKDSLWTEPETDNVDNLRSSNDGTWTADSNLNPAIFANLVEAEEEPVPLGAIVIDGNAEAANIFFKPSLDDDEPYKSISVDDNNEPKVNALQYFHDLGT